MESFPDGKFYVTRSPLLASEYMTNQVLVSIGFQIRESAGVLALLTDPEVVGRGMNTHKDWRPLTARERKA
jgi:hypothetical protein